MPCRRLHRGRPSRPTLSPSLDKGRVAPSPLPLKIAKAKEEKRWGEGEKGERRSFRGRDKEKSEDRHKEKKKALKERVGEFGEEEKILKRKGE